MEIYLRDERRTVYACPACGYAARSWEQLGLHCSDCGEFDAFQQQRETETRMAKQRKRFAEMRAIAREA